MNLQHIPHPDDWATAAGLGTCFHQALSRWAHLRAAGDTRWWVAVAVVNTEDRHIHAWLESGDDVVTRDGHMMNRETYHEFLNVERDTLRLLNPRDILRKLRKTIDRDAVDALLVLWGLPYTVNEQGGVMPADNKEQQHG